MSRDDLPERVAAAHRAASGERALRKLLGAHESAIHNRVWVDPETGAPRYGTSFQDGAPIHVKHRGETHQFREDQEDELEKFVADVRAALSRPEYRIRRSLELEDAIASRAGEDGVLKLVKAAADQVVQSGDVEAVIVGMRAHEAVVRGPDLALASCHQSLLVFVCPEDEAVRRITAIRAPVRKPAPEKVAIKMVLLRIRKLQQQVRDINESIKVNISSNASSGRMFPQDMLVFMPGVPTDGGREALNGYLALCLSHAGRKPDPRLVHETVKILTRQEVTDDVVEDAMKIAQVEEVMES